METPLASTAVLTFSAGDGGRSVEARIGQRFDVSLAENGSTGYRWEIVADGAPTLALTGDETRASAAPPGLVGAPVTRVFHFRASATGDAKIALVDRRPFGTYPPTATFALTVVVRP
ncbi:MAG TPA: protease inhibitor I42 family protein [Candidatus Limnocylindria bacterium]|nr:protease inhibitor I42 family protein [Candidatus Limnocylindria bacterium]